MFVATKTNLRGWKNHQVISELESRDHFWWWHGLGEGRRSALICHRNRFIIVTGKNKLK